MSISEYKHKAVQIAKEDSKRGFCFHVIRNPYSQAICKLTGMMAKEGFCQRDRQAVELAWENSLEGGAV